MECNMEYNGLENNFEKKLTLTEKCVTSSLVSPPIQKEVKGQLKDLLTPEDSAITDLSPSTDSSPFSNTEPSNKTDVGPGSPRTPGPSTSPQPKKDGKNSEQRQKLAKERREERAKYIGETRGTNSHTFTSLYRLIIPNWLRYMHQTETGFTLVYCVCFLSNVLQTLD